MAKYQPKHAAGQRGSKEAYIPTGVEKKAKLNYTESLESMATEADKAEQNRTVNIVPEKTFEKVPEKVKEKKVKKSKSDLDYIDKEQNGFVKALKGIVTAVLVLGIIFFLVPIYKNYFTITSIIAVAFLFFLILLVNLRWVCTGHGRRTGVKIVWNIISLCCILLVAWFGFLTYQMFTVDYVDTSDDATVVVLGARVYEEGVSVSLQNRLNTAIEYLNEHPNAKVVVTGGQGANEPWSEASAEKEYLIANGIKSKRIFMEDKSTSTEENLGFTKAILAENKLGNSIVLVTQDFHMFRASSLAEDLGYTVYKRACDTNIFLFPTYYSREVLALTRYYINKYVTENFFNITI